MPSAGIIRAEYLHHIRGIFDLRRQLECLPTYSDADWKAMTGIGIADIKHLDRDANVNLTLKQVDLLTQGFNGLVETLASRQVNPEIVASARLLEQMVRHELIIHIEEPSSAVVYYPAAFGHRPRPAMT